LAGGVCFVGCCLAGCLAGCLAFSEVSFSPSAGFSEAAFSAASFSAASLAALSAASFSEASLAALSAASLTAFSCSAASFLAFWSSEGSVRGVGDFCDAGDFPALPPLACALVWSAGVPFFCWGVCCLPFGPPFGVSALGSGSLGFSGSGLGF